MTDVLALIPARGGSKGVLRKNVRQLAGVPLVAYSIQHALASQRITRTVVSTDDPEIAEIARHYGAEVPFMRPADIAGDLTPDLEVFQHALTWLAAEEEYAPDLVVHLRPTDPIRRPETIDVAIELIAGRPDVGALRSVAPARPTPYKMWRIGCAGLLEPLLSDAPVPEPWNRARQELPIIWVQTGYLDIVRPSVILEQGSMTGTRILAFPIDEPTIDIDTEDDLIEAERLLR